MRDPREATLAVSTGDFQTEVYNLCQGMSEVTRQKAPNWKGIIDDDSTLYQKYPHIRPFADAHGWNLPNHWHWKHAYHRVMEYQRLARGPKHGGCELQDHSQTATKQLVKIIKEAPEHNTDMLNIALRPITRLSTHGTTLGQEVISRVEELYKTAIGAGKSFKGIERDTEEIERAKKLGIPVIQGDALNPPIPQNDTLGILNLGGQKDCLEAIRTNPIFTQYSRLIAPVANGNPKCIKSILNKFEASGFKVVDVWRKAGNMLHWVTLIPQTSRTA
jgi:hypothetical protein